MSDQNPTKLMMPAKTALVVASAVFAFMPPRRAHQLAMIVIILATAMTAWMLLNSAGVQSGVVKATLQDGDTLLVAMSPLWTEAQTALRLTDPTEISRGALLFAYGAQSDGLFEATHWATTPWLGEAAALIIEMWNGLLQSAPALLAALSLLIVICANLMLRLVNAVQIGAAAGFVVFGGLNAAVAHQALVLPQDVLEMLFLSLMLAGAAIGFKATLFGDTSAWLRLAAATLAAVGGLLFHPFSEIPIAAVMVFPIVALIAPSAPLIALGAFLLTEAFNLQAWETAIAAAALLGVRMLQFWLTHPKASGPSTAQPVARAQTGAIPLHHLL